MKEVVTWLKWGGWGEPSQPFDGGGGPHTRGVGGDLYLYSLISSNVQDCRPRNALTGSGIDYVMNYNAVRFPFRSRDARFPMRSEVRFRYVSFTEVVAELPRGIFRVFHIPSWASS